MLNKLKDKLKNNTEIFALALLVIITIFFTSYYNHVKSKILDNYKTSLNNIYLKKTINHILDNLEPRFRKIDHRILPGETFNNILEKYGMNKKEIPIKVNKVIEKLKIKKEIRFGKPE